MTINLINRAAGAAGRRLDPARRRAGTTKDAYRRHGVTGAIAALGAHIPLGLLAIDWYDVYETTPAPATADQAGLALARATREDAAALSELRGESAGEVRARFDAGDEAWIARDGDRVVGFVWIRSGVSPEGIVEFVLADDERWAYDLYVDETHRGRRLAPALKVLAVAELAGDGVRRVLSRIEHLNEPSQRAARFYGARRLASFAVVSLPGVAVIHERHTGGRRRVSVVRRRGVPVRRTTGPHA